MKTKAPFFWLYLTRWCVYFRARMWLQLAGTYYVRRLAHPDPAERRKAAHLYQVYEKAAEKAFKLLER